MNSRIRRPLYISLKSWLCCCSLPTVAPQQKSSLALLHKRCPLTRGKELSVIFSQKSGLVHTIFPFCANFLKNVHFTASMTDFASYYLCWTLAQNIDIRKNSVLNKDKHIYTSLLSVHLIFSFFRCLDCIFFILTII